MAIALVSVPGYGHGILPGALPTLATALREAGLETQCHYLCAEFCDLLLRTHPRLVEFDYRIAQWRTTYHEVYFHDKLCASGVLGVTSMKDGFAPSASARRGLSRSPRAREFCELMHRLLARRAREIALAGPAVVGFSCSQNSQFYTSLFAAMEILRQARRRPRLVFGGGLFDAGNAGRFAEAFPMVDEFVARDGVDALVAWGRGPETPEGRPRWTVGPPSRPSGGWKAELASATRLPGLLRRQKGYYHVVVSWARGCSWGRCRFCCHAVREGRVAQDAARLASDLRWLHDTHGIREVLFGDLQLNGSPGQVSELTGALQGLPDAMKLWGLINSRCVSRQALQAFKDARFVHLQCGIEAFNQPILDRMNKGTTVLNNVLALRLAHELRFDGFFSPILESFPGERPQDARDTLAVLRTIRHLLRRPVTAEVIGCFRHRGAWLGAGLAEDEPELGPSRWMDPDETATESLNEATWAEARDLIRRAGREKAFLVARVHPDRTRIVDGRQGPPRCQDLRGPSKALMDALLESPRSEAEVQTLAGGAGPRILRGFVRKGLVLASAGAYLGVAVRVEDLGVWESRPGVRA